ncbi:MAG: dephospho-CoA kinase [Pseudonocardia sp.]|nr:dephospho-CoA kinase [Pseudonocardia sp.]
MLRVGLTGGIGAGKSTVAQRMVELGAVLVDADVVAREVVSPGSAGLARVVEEFGTRVLGPGGELDRPVLADIVFDDPSARQRLNRIVHPLVAAHTAELVAEVPPDRIVVQDIPLLVEARMESAFALVIVVDAAEDERVRRLIEQRGMTERAARARIVAQADQAARRAAADVWLDNSGSRATILAAVDRLWWKRLLPFEATLRSEQPRPSGPPVLVGPDPTWPEQFVRLAARIRHAAGSRAVQVDHIGSTSVPGLPAKDVIDIQLGVRSLTEVDEFRPALYRVGFLHRPELQQDSPKPGDQDPMRWRKRFFTAADPGRPVNLHVREVSSANFRYALLFRDWLRADARFRADYFALKQRLAAEHATDETTLGYATGKEPWFDQAWSVANLWANRVGWRMPPDQAAGHFGPGKHTIVTVASRSSTH